MKKISYIISFFVLISIIISLFFKPFKITGNPVDNGEYKKGQVVLGERFKYLFKDPKIGDVIVYKNKDTKAIGRIYDIKKEDAVIIYLVRDDAFVYDDYEYDEVTKDKIVSRIYLGLPFKEKPYALFEPSSIPGYKKYNNKICNYEIDLPESWVSWPDATANPSETIRIFVNREPDDSYMGGYTPETISLTIGCWEVEANSKIDWEKIFSDPVGFVDEGEKVKVTKLADLNIDGKKTIKVLREGKLYQEYYEVNFTIEGDERSGYNLKFFMPTKFTLETNSGLIDQIANSFKVNK